MNIIDAIKHGTNEELTAALVDGLNEKQEDILNVKRIAIASETFNTKED